VAKLLPSGILLALASSCATGQVCGSLVDTYEGVNSYYNGIDTGSASGTSCQIPAIFLVGQQTVPPSLVPGQTPPPYQLGQDGEEYQCVEFIRRFYRIAKQVATSGWKGTYGDAKDFYTHPGYFGLVSYPNNGTVAPQRDDIVGFAPITGISSAGHVAVIKEIDDTGGPQYTVKLIEQNTNFAHQLTVQRQEQSDGNDTYYTYVITPRCEACLPIQGLVRLPPIEFVTGPTSLSAIGIVVDGYQTIATGWSQSASYSGVNIAVELGQGDGTTSTAFLTNQIGPGTTVANESAQTSFVIPSGGTDTGGIMTTLFTNINLGPGTYYVTLANSGYGGGVLYLADPAKAIITTAAGAIRIGDFGRNGLAYQDQAYPPASPGLSTSSTLVYKISVVGAP